MIARLRERKRHAVVLMSALQRQCDEVDKEIQTIKKEKEELEIAHQYIAESYEKLRMKRREKETASKEFMALRKEIDTPRGPPEPPRQTFQSSHLPLAQRRSSVNLPLPEPQTKEPIRGGYSIGNLEDSDPEPDDADDFLPPTPDGKPLSPEREDHPPSTKDAPEAEDEEDIYGQTEDADDDSIAKQFGMTRYNRGSMPY